MNAQHVARAFTAALNPKLLALDLLLIENRPRRTMLRSILAGGMGLASAIGLFGVLTGQASAVNSQVSLGVGLAIGVFLLASGLLILAGVLPVRHEARAPAPGKKSDEIKQEKGENWAQRALREPRPGIAFGIGAVVGMLGAEYLAGLHNMITGKYSTATRVIAVMCRRHHRVPADHHPEGFPGVAARGNRCLPPAVPGLAGRPRRATRGLDLRPARRLPAISALTRLL